jgi:hypothetical protein
LKYCQRSIFLGADFLLPGIPLGSFFFIAFFLEVDGSIGSEGVEINITHWLICSVCRENKANKIDYNSYYVKQPLKTVSTVQQQNWTGNQRF